MAACSGFGGIQKQCIDICHSLFQNLLMERCPFTLVAFGSGILLAPLSLSFYPRQALSKCMLQVIRLIEKHVIRIAVFLEYWNASGDFSVA